MNSLVVLSIFILLVVHLFAGRLSFFNTSSRCKWLSMAGGVSVAYVFVHVLPELKEGQEVLKQSDYFNFIKFFESHAYFIAMLGLMIFYGLEKLVKTSKYKSRDGSKERNLGIFYIHIFSFAIYNALIGYLLVHREDHSIQGLGFYVIAMGLHLIVNDIGLREHHEHIYDHIGRWILGFSLFMGWLVGINTEITEPAIVALFSFLAGGVILNVLKEELPAERDSRFWPFALGALLYAFLMFTI